MILSEPDYSNKEIISYRFLFKMLYKNLKTVDTMIAAYQNNENQAAEEASPYSSDAYLHKAKAQAYADMRFLLRSVITTYGEYAEPEMSFANWRQPEQDDDEADDEGEA